MATVKLVPSTYFRSNTNYVTVTNDSNMYYDTSHTTNYATLRGRNRNSSTAYYAFIGGFNFDAVPSNATVNSFTVRIRCYRSSNQRTGSNFYMRLTYAHTSGSVISNTTTSTNIGTTASTITIPTGSLTWTQMSGYGDDFSIEVPLASNSGSYPYVYVYGAEIEVDYTAETVHPTSVSVSPTTASIEVGGTVTLTETLLPSNASDKSVTWSTSNSSVATVSNGVVTGVGAGSATITVTTVDGNKTATCAVTVTAAVKTTYALATSMEPGKTYVVATGNGSSAPIASFTSITANGMSTNVDASADLSALVSGTTYHITGYGTAQSFGASALCNWTIDTDVTYSSGVNVSFEQTSSVLNHIYLYSSYIRFNFISTDNRAIITELTISGNSGTFYMLSNQSAGSRLLTGVPITGSNGQIQLTASQEAKCAFDCVQYTSGNDVTITLKSGNAYLYSDSGTGLRWNTPTTLDRFWHWNVSDAKFWQFKSTTSDGYTDTSSEYKYYLELDSSNNFTDNHVTSPSIQDSTIPAIYLFTPYTPPPIPTDTLYYKAGYTDTLLHHSENQDRESTIQGYTHFNTSTGQVFYIDADITSHRAGGGGTTPHTVIDTTLTYSGSNVSTSGAVQVRLRNLSSYLVFDCYCSEDDGYGAWYSGYLSIYSRADGGGWIPVVKAYKKINGSWVEQSDLTTVFNSQTNYIKG